MSQVRDYVEQSIFLQNSMQVRNGLSFMSWICELHAMDWFGSVVADV